MSSLYLKELSMGAMQRSGTLNWQFKQKHKNKTKHLTVEFASKWGENKDTSFTLEMERQHTIFSHIQQKNSFFYFCQRETCQGWWAQISVKRKC